MIIDASKMKFDLKIIILVLSAAWTPAFAIGGGLVRWGNAMDQRVTVQETTNQNLATVLNKLDATLSSDVKELRVDIKRLELEIASMKANNK